MAAKANPKPASGTIAANARGPAVRKTAPLMTEAPAIATARAELSRPCVRPRKAGGAIRARAAIVPRWVAPNDKPCRICRAKVASRPDSNVITAKEDRRRPAELEAAKSATRNVHHGSEQREQHDF